ncbi:MAG TPA: hypothetical protein VIU64_21230 [Polyangia bacterium]
MPPKRSRAKPAPPPRSSPPATTVTTAPGGPLAALPPDLATLLEGPAIMHLGTRSADLLPSSTLAFGLRPAGDGREVTLFLPVELSAIPLGNLRDNGQMALSAVRPTTSQAIQLKGVWLGERRTDESDRAFVEHYRDLLTTEMGLVGVPHSIWRRVSWWPTLALRMEVRDVFVQTPGPGAGRRCDHVAIDASAEPVAAGGPIAAGAFARAAGGGKAER